MFAFVIKLKTQFSLHNCQFFSRRIMETLKKKRNLAEISRETPENTRNSQSQNILDPGMAQEYVSQVSEGLKGGSLKKFPKNSVGRSRVFWLLCPGLTSFF